jgi:hypothetical protein
LSENASAHGTAQDYIYPHDAWYGDSTLIFKSHWIPKSELDSIRDGFLATGNSPSAVDSITLLYLFEIQRSVPQYQFLSIHNNITQEHLDSLNKYSYVLDYPSPLLDKSSSKELTLRYNMGSSKYRWAKVDIGTTSRLFNYFSAIDISQLYVHRQIRLNSDVESVRSITFDFVGNTVFSDMTPKPDEITMNSITFNDPEKITKIRENGLTFHVNFTDNTNVQTARMFFVTTLLSILIAYWVALVTQGIKNIISKRSKERREKQQKTQRS